MGVAGAAVTGGLGVLNFIEAGNEADAIREQSEIDARQSEFNADLTDLQREDLLDKSSDAITRRQNQVRGMLGSQKAALAAQGIEVDGEIGVDLERDERATALDDTQAIKNNAWRDAFGLKQKAQDLRTQAKFGRASGQQQARNTLVTGGISSLGSFASAGSQLQEAGFFTKKTKKTKKKK